MEWFINYYGDRRRNNPYICCDGKNDIYELCKGYLKLSNVESGTDVELQTVRRLKIMEQTIRQ